MDKPPTGSAVIETWKDPGKHGKRHHCPGCDWNCNTVGIPSLVYTFEVCRCGEPDYDHLVEQIWHRTCFAKSEAS